MNFRSRVAACTTDLNVVALRHVASANLTSTLWHLAHQPSEV